MFTKGMKRPEGAGIKKGTKHNNWKRPLMELLKKHDINLFEEILLDIPHMHPDKRNGVRLALAEFIMPKMKALHVSGMPDQTTNIQIATVIPTRENKAAIARLLEDPASLAAMRLLSDKIDSEPALTSKAKPQKDTPDDSQD